jgi:hypothetical protein
MRFSTGDGQFLFHALDITNHCQGESQASAGSDMAQDCTSIVDDIRGGVHSVPSAWQQLENYSL